MPYLKTSQEWLHHSTLLVQARPSTTRITTKYNLTKPPPPKEENAPATEKPDPPRATLSLKTYDPASGTTLKYKTTKQAEVSRLIQILGRLGRRMAGLPEKEDVVMTEVKEEAVEEKAPQKVADSKTAPIGKKGKKKGKK
jgi:hypothetical protein